MPAARRARAENDDLLGHVMLLPVVIVLDPHHVVQLGRADFQQPHVLDGDRAVFSARLVLDDFARDEASA